jgi:hypothetical protein
MKIGNRNQERGMRIMKVSCEKWVTERAFRLPARPDGEVMF